MKKLKKQDYVKGFVVAGLSSMLFFIQDLADLYINSDTVFEWKKIGMSFVGGGVGYLIKNFFTSEKTT